MTHSSPTQNHLGQPIGPALPNWQPPAIPERIPLEGRFCRLEPLNVEKHASALFEANALDTDGRNWTYLPYGPFQTLEEYANWVASVCQDSESVFYAIIDRQLARPVGVVAYIRIIPASGSIEVGHVNYSPLLQQSPAATEAMFLMMRQVFELGYRRYEWKCDALNAASRAAAQRLGFSFEGIFRNATVYKGRSRDTTWFSVTEAEWPRLNEAFCQWLAPSNFDEQTRQKVRLTDLTRPLLRPRD